MNRGPLPEASGQFLDASLLQWLAELSPSGEFGEGFSGVFGVESPKPFEPTFDGHTRYRAAADLLAPNLLNRNNVLNGLDESFLLLGLLATCGTTAYEHSWSHPTTSRNRVPSEDGTGPGIRDTAPTRAEYSATLERPLDGETSPHSKCCLKIAAASGMKTWWCGPALSS